MKKGKIQLEVEQWNSIGEAIFLMGRQRNPTKTESFFAPIDIAAHCLSHLGDEYRQHNIAIPHELNLYCQRFLSKDLINKPEQFRCLQATLIADGLLSREFLDGKSFYNFVLDAYEAYVEAEYRKALTLTAPREFIKFKTRAQFAEALKMVFSYCHHYVSYSPLRHRNRAEAYQRSKVFFTKNWMTFLTDSAHHTGRAKDKFAAFKQYMQFGGVQRWYRNQLKHAKETLVTTTKGAMGGFLMEDEHHVLNVIQGFLISHELGQYLPPVNGRSYDFLSSAQVWLRDSDVSQRDMDDFKWLLKVEMSEEFYNSELEHLDKKLMTWHNKKVDEKEKKNAYCKQVLACFPLWTNLCLALEEDSREAKRTRDECSFQKLWGQQWRNNSPATKAGELIWETTGTETESDEPKAKRARWTRSKVPRLQGLYKSKHRELMEEHLRPQYLYQLAASDEGHIFQERRKLWAKWWADYNEWDRTRHNDRTHTWDGKWRLDGKTNKGDNDSEIRQALWDCLCEDPPVSTDESMLLPGRGSDQFVHANLAVVLSIRGLVEFLYKYKFRAPSYNDMNLLEGTSQLSDKSIYVAIKLGFVRREWGREHRGDTAGNHDSAIMRSLSEWVLVYLLRDLDILLLSFYECCMQHCPLVKRAIFDRLCESEDSYRYDSDDYMYDNPSESPKWEDRILWKVAKEIYSERGETEFPSFQDAPKRKEVPVSATYEKHKPKLSKKATKEQQEWFENAVMEKPLDDYGYWETDSNKIIGLNPKEEKRSALLWRRWKTRVGLNNESDSDYSAGLESDSDDEGILIDGKWTFEEVMDCVPTLKEGKWVGVIKK